MSKLNDEIMTNDYRLNDPSNNCHAFALNFSPSPRRTGAREAENSSYLFLEINFF